MHVLPASANDCILQTNSFGLVNRHIFRPIDRNADSLDRTETVIVSKHDTVVVANSEHRIPKCIRSCFVESDNIIWRGTKSAG